MKTSDNGRSARPRGGAAAPPRPRDRAAAPPRSRDRAAAPDRPRGGAAAPDRPRDRAAAPPRPHDAQRRSQRQTRPPRSSAPQKPRKKRKPRTRLALGRVFGQTFVRRLLLCVLAAALAGLLMIVVLRVQTISVVGNSRYTAAEIQEAAGVTPGSALLLVSKTGVASRIRAQMPYISEVRVGVSMPDTVKIEVVELETTFAVAADDGSFWLINSDGRLVEQITAKAASEFLKIEGVRIQNAAEGQTLEVQDDPKPEQDEPEDEENAALPEAPAAQRMDTALQIIRQLEASEDIRTITSVDVTSIYDLQIWYGTRFQVKLGNTSELSYKLDYMLAAIAQLESYQTGVLDLTFQEAKKATFIPWSS